MGTPSKRKTEPQQPKVRKPPRLTTAIIKHASRFGFNVHISQKPDGTVETELTRPGSGDPATEGDLRKLL